MKRTEDDFEFEQIREHSPQWSVKCHGKEIAIVTERTIATPPYNIRWPDGTDEPVETRDIVIQRLLDREEP